MLVSGDLLNLIFFAGGVVVGLLLMNITVYYFKA